MKFAEMLPRAGVFLKYYLAGKTQNSPDPDIGCMNQVLVSMQKKLRQGNFCGVAHIAKASAQ